jgi:toxin ParE1/3/4
MAKKAELAPRARHDLLAAVRRIAKDSPAAARRFRAAIIAAGELVGDHPLAGSLRPEFAPGPTRFLALQRFPYLLAYNPKTSPPLILRIIHAARDVPSVMSEPN